MIKKFKILKKYHKNQKGSYVIFFVLFVLPIISFLLMLAFDVAAIYTKRRSVQNILDEAAIEGVKFFPYKDYAANVTSNYLQSNGLSNKDYIVTSNENGLAISYEKRYTLVFSNLVKALAGETEPITYPVKAFTYLVPSVSDYLLLLDRNTYNSPNFDEAPWGDMGEWPSLNYFEQNKEDFPNTRYSTEQCFNEVYLPLKKLIIDTYNFLGSMSLNSVGVGIFPGAIYSREADELKGIKKVDFSKNESVFLNYNDDYGTSSRACLDASSSENVEDKYKLPEILEDYKINKEFDYDVDDEGKTSLATAIWSLPVHKGSISNFQNVLDYSVRVLLSVEKREDRRKNNFEVSKNLIIFTSKLPDDEVSLKNELETLNSILKGAEIKINIVFVLLKTDKVYTKAKFIDENLTGNASNFKIFVYSSDNEDELTQKLHKFLWLDKKEGSIWM